MLFVAVGTPLLMLTITLNCIDLKLHFISFPNIPSNILYTVQQVLHEVDPYV